ncbi:MAG: cation:proton antiporter, partial [Terriglobales bacterium]
MNLLLAFALTLLAAVLISAWTERTILSTTVLFLAVGLWLGRESWATEAVSPPLLRVVADLALFSVLFSDGMRAGSSPAPPGARSLVVRALALGMPLTILAIAEVAHYLTRLPWLESWLLGAVLSPTDPIFVSALLGNEAVPARLRRLLNIESGINDGMALPPVLILLGTLGPHPVSPGVILLELAAGVGIGVAIPWLGLRLEASRFLGAAGVFRQLNA